MKKVDTPLIVRVCLPQFAVGLFTTMLNTYLISFYQPSKASGLSDLIPQGRNVLGVMTIIGMTKAIGHIIDAVTGPLLASGSDKSKNKNGRRIPLMKVAVIPFGLCGVIIFSFTLYMIPYNELIPEMIQEGPLRVNAYTISSFFFVTGSALGYVSTLIVSLFKNHGISTLIFWRMAFGMYTLIGIIY